MADFLASFNLGAQVAAPSNNLSCGSVDDLQLHLRRILDAKATPTRAEHVSTTMELRPTVRFHLLQSEGENGAVDGLNDGTSLGEAATNEERSAREILRNVGANEALMNQPQADPVLQTSITKHIIAVLSAVDGSNWTVREISRETQGWTFTYLCRHSSQVWNRQHAKNSQTPVVGEFNPHEPDPILTSRPAFDCRGSVVISFNRQSRLISVKYEHTPLHKTVGDLLEYFKPPPRELGSGMQRQLQQKAAQQRTPKQKTPRKKPEKKAQDEMGSSRKRNRKSNAANQQAAPIAAMTDPNNAQLGLESSLMQLDPAVSALGAQHENQPSSQQTGQGFNDYPQGLVGGEASKSVNQAGSTNGSQPPPGVTFPVNITPAEANRRRDAAITMLSNAGVAPDSLSTEQFSIFSNQSPDLQKESLSMLVKYGAERLRIVHPNAKEGTPSGQANASSATNQDSQTGSSQPTTSKELVPQPGTCGNGVAETSASADATPTRKRRKMGKSRTACFQCKARKTKCPKERPICSECEAQGDICEYAPQKPRKRPPKKSETVVVESEAEDDDQDDEVDEDAEADEPNQSSIQPDEPNYSSYPQMPVSDILAPAVEATSDGMHALPDYFQPSHGLAHLAQDNTSTMTQHHVSTETRQSYDVPITEPTQHIEPRHLPATTETISSENRWGQRPVSSRSRRALPKEPNRQQPINDSMANSHSSSDANAGSRYNNQTTQHSAHHPPPPPNGTQVREGMEQASALARAAIQYHQQSPTEAAAILAHSRSSPFQAANVPRAKSRQGLRGQSRTPVSDPSIGRGYQPPPAPTQHTGTNSSSNQRPDQLGGIVNHGDQGGYRTRAMSHSIKAGAYKSFSQAPAMPSVSQTAEPHSQNTSMGMSLSSQAPSMTTSYQTAASDQWLGSRSGHDRSYDSTSSYNTQSAYTQPAAQKPTPQPKQGYSTRSTRSTRSDNTSFGQQQSSYSSFQAPQQNQQSQLNNQQSNWYNFNNSNPANSFSAANHGSGYPWSGV